MTNRGKEGEGRERERERGARERERERVYSAHNSARSIGECLGKRTWTTHTVPRDHRASPLAYIRLHGSPKTIPWPFSTDRAVVYQAGPAVRYFDTVDTRLISIRYGRRERNCRARHRYSSRFLLCPDTLCVRFSSSCSSPASFTPWNSSPAKRFVRLRCIFISRGNTKKMLFRGSVEENPRARSR